MFEKKHKKTNKNRMIKWDIHMSLKTFYMFLNLHRNNCQKPKKTHQCSWATACSSGASASAALAAFSSASLASFRQRNFEGRKD